jgi:hypothetical protein
MGAPQWLADEAAATPKVVATSPPLKPSSVKPSRPPLSKRRRWLYAGGAALLILVAAAGGWWWLHVHAAKKPVAVVVRKVKPVPPAPLYDPLTGLPVASKALARQPVIGVMIENLYPDARPQSGLGQAGVVYEALAEGGITRFLSIFQEPLPTSIGPVRSLRPYYLDWGLEYGIPIAHAGGSEPALNAIPSSGLKDINALAYDGSYFYRTTDRAAPHNLYTDNQKLAALDTQLGFATAPSFTPLPRKADKPVNPAPHPIIKINFSTSPYAVEYDFDAATDAYGRVMGGTPHIDRNTNQQIQVKNVIVEYVPTTYSTQQDGKPETNMNLIGQGPALVFDDGTVTAATWNKSSDSAPTKLLNASGKQIALNRGNTWYEVIPTGNVVSY